MTSTEKPEQSHARRARSVPGRARARWRAACVGMCLVAAAAHTASGAPDEPIVCSQVPVSAPTDRLGHDADLTDGTRIVAIISGTPGATVLTNGFTAAGRPDVSFDGKRILFVGRKAAGDPVSVWEMDTNGKNARRITHPATNCREAIYLTTTFTLDAERPVQLIAFVATTGRGMRALYTCHHDGSRVTRITFTPNDVTDPLLLSDGRLLFAMEGPPSHETAARRSTRFFTINTDGTDVFPFAAMHDEPPARGAPTPSVGTSLVAPAVDSAVPRSAPCETPNEWVVYVESPSSGGDPGGSLIAVPRTRSLRVRRTLAGADAGIYYSPAPAAGGKLLVSYRQANEDYGLHVLDPATGKRTETLYDDPDWHEIDARRIAPRTAPKGHSSVVDERVTTGKLYCLDMYLSEHSEVRDLRPDGITKVRITRALTGGHDNPIAMAAEKPEHTGASVAQRTLGEAKVAPDGSFFLEVPARIPLRLEALDREGNVLQGMQSWIWVMPQERRGCIGCHEDRELTPPNRHVYALWKKPQRIGLPKPPRPQPRSEAKKTP